MEETSDDKKKIIDTEIDLDPEMPEAMSKIQKLKRELETCRKEKEEYLEGWRRAKADYANAEREAGNRTNAAIAYAEIKILKEFLVLADGFEQAFAHPPADLPVDSKWLTGVRGIYSQFEKILEEAGVTHIKTIHEKFNPEYHEAIAVSEASTEADDGTITAVLQEGYLYHDRVLRPAKVNVAQYQKEN